MSQVLRVETHLASSALSNLPLLQISGEVETPLILDFDALQELPHYEVHNFPIVCATTKTVLAVTQHFKGVLLRDLLAQAVLKTSNKPLYRQPIYIAARAVDGYTAMFTWHEIFNARGGDSVYVIHTCEYEPLAQLMLLCTSDVYSAPRWVRNLNRIEVKQLS
ncbi:sulfite oxidase-like oxidoreductase [Beggiatoa alba B18LD]|uniref:Sulfite oxidase-like oxidoreductase n=1 Tax=Beggiatoa alba B18LD TaxID=395493 RepID=I3CBU8_9GAMM|nr:molybdopterin-dependent oxidoreductase [Beggiatoa alba]EIJ41091.1 sulfite oxidase-like oxidoreductase [Beggiatoa alba B18LD]